MDATNTLGVGLCSSARRDQEKTFPDTRIASGKGRFSAHATILMVAPSGRWRNCVSRRPLAVLEVKEKEVDTQQHLPKNGKHAEESATVRL